MSLINIPNISIKEFIKETKATPKIGIEFTNWSNQNSNFFNPTEGRMIVFPSYLYHYVQENKSNQDRISVSFNIRLD